MPEDIEVVLGETVGFVPDRLEQAQGGIVAFKADGVGFSEQEKCFFLFGKRHQNRRFTGHLPKSVTGGVELAQAAVNQDQVGENFFTFTGPAAKHLGNHGVIVNPADFSDAESSVALLEGAAVNEADQGTHCFGALNVGDVHAFDNADFVRAVEQLFEFFQTLAGIDLEKFGLNVFINPATIGQTFQRGNFIAAPGGLFVILGGGKLVHLLLQLLEDDRTLGFQKTLKTLDVPAITFLVDAVGAGAGTLFDIEEDAGAKETTLIIIEMDFEFARAKAKNPLENLNHPAQVPGTGERAEKLAVFTRLAGNVNPGEIIAAGDFQIGKGLVVHLPGIVGRLNVLDQSRFLQNGIHLGFAFQDADVGDFFRQFDDFWPATGQQIGSGLKITRHPFTQALGFADIEHPLVSVLHEVHTRGLGEFLDLCANMQ